MNEQLTAYQQSSNTKTESKACFLAALSYLGIPDRFNDIGCGEGHLVGLAAKMGIPSFGMDLNCLPNLFLNGEIVKHDLTGNLRDLYVAPANLTFSLEVGEHLPEDQAIKYCHYLSQWTSEYLVFSAAIPGQGGSGHVNEQPKEYWRDRLKDEGFVYLDQMSDDLKVMWEIVAGKAWWYPQNVQVFFKS